MKPEEVLEKINDDRFRWIDIYYTDVLGNYKCVTVPSRKLSKRNFKEGILAVDHESMFYTEGEHITLIPDSDSYAPVPWEPSTARLSHQVTLQTIQEVYLIKRPNYLRRKLNVNYT